MFRFNRYASEKGLARDAGPSIPRRDHRRRGIKCQSDHWRLTNEKTSKFSAENIDIRKLLLIFAFKFNSFPISPRWCFRLQLGDFPIEKNVVINLKFMSTGEF